MSNHADLNTLGRAAADAFIYTLPLVVMETFRRRRIARSGMHRLLHAPRLLTPRDRAITTPNNDTLYTDFWLDLAAGPATVTLPSTAGRYISLHIVDAWSNTVAALSPRNTGTDPLTITLIGPDANASRLTGNVMRCPTRYTMGLFRTLVDGPADIPGARDAQAAMQLTAPTPDDREGPLIDRHAPWPDYFAEAARLMRLNPPPVTDLGLLRQLAPLGLDTEGTFTPEKFSPAQAAAIQAGVEQAKNELQQMQQGTGAGDALPDGWQAPPRNMSVFGQDYRNRAHIAITALLALPLEEATYFRADAMGGRGLDGRQMWRWHFPAGHPLPADAFWSLTLYEPTDAGESFLVENPIDRYAIGDRTPGLTLNADGSLDIWIGHDNPGAARESNWLPAPAGPFNLWLRAYHPAGGLLDGSYQLPEPSPA